MPDIASLLEKTVKKKFKKSSYRPWNYMDEIEKEEKEEVKLEPIQPVTEAIKAEAPAQKEEPPIDYAPQAEKKKFVAPPEPQTIFQPKPSIPEEEENVAHHAISYANVLTKEQLASPLYNILRLSGHQKKIFTFILERCVSRGLLSSGSITSDMLTSLTNTSLKMVNTSIQRLVEKKLLARENGKRGRGGFYCFGISQEVNDAAMEYRRLISVEKLDSLKQQADPNPNPDFSKFDARKSSSSLPKEWDEIDIEPLSQIGFTKGHLLQLYKQDDLTAAVVQDSINHFYYDLKYNNKQASITKSSPIGYFMGILKRASVYNAPENYESPKDRALRELIAQKKAEKEKRDHLLKELLNMAFDDWQAKLTQAEKDKIIPEEIRKNRLTGAKVASLKSYFTENVWPEMEKKEFGK